MKKLILINAFLIVQISLSAQCANNYIGSFEATDCTFTIESWPSEIKSISPDKIVISHFANIPYGIINCVDTIIADLNCNDSSLTLYTVTYSMYAGILQYSGSGSMSGGSIILNLHQRNPDGVNDFCYRYDNFTGIKTDSFSNSNFEIYPNPAKESITIKSDFTGKYMFKLFNILMLERKMVIIVNPGSQKINLSGIENGIYIYHVTDLNDNSIKTGKLIISN